MRLAPALAAGLLALAPAWVSAFALEEDPPDKPLDLIYDNATHVFPEPPEPTVGERLLLRLRQSWFTSPVLVPTEAEFVELALEPSRPYHLAVLFISDAAGCELAVEELKAVAQAYWSNLDRRRNVTGAVLFFMQVDLRVSPGLFRAHKVTKVPALLHIPPMDASAQQAQPFPADWWRPYDDGLRFGPWLAKRAQVEIPGPSVLGGSDMESFVQLGFVGQIAIVLLINARRFLKKEGWMWLSGIVYTLSVSGMIFCVLRGAAPFGMSREHGILFLYPDKGQQFLFEGVVVAIVTAGCGAMLVSAFFFAHGRDVWSEILDEPTPSLPAHERRILFNQNANTSLLMFLAGIATLSLFFLRKAPWYRPSFTNFVSR